MSILPPYFSGLDADLPPDIPFWPEEVPRS